MADEVLQWLGRFIAFSYNYFGEMGKKLYDDYHRDK